jgi:hypothetical protein
MTELERSRWFDGAWLVLCVVTGSVWCVAASPRLSATFDEPTYVRLGLESWHTGSSGRLLDLGTMPLPMHLDTLPIYLWERWREEPLDAVHDLDRLLPVARLGTLPFWWLLLAYGWCIARRVAGPWGGRIAVVLLAFDPNLLAHATLATSDIPVTACLLALLYHFQSGRDVSWGRRVGLPACWFALAVLCKASALTFGILGMVVVGIASREGQLAGWRSWLPRRALRRDVGQVLALGLLVVFWYCGTDGRPSPSFVAWAHGLPHGPGQSALVWLAEHLQVFSNAGVALARQVRHNFQGHGVYLLGQVAPRSFWYYFPVALSIKCPIPLLALPLVLGVLCPRVLRSWPCRVAAVFLLFTFLCRVQIGIRLVLPLIALAAVALGAALAAALAALPVGVRRRALLGTGVLGLGWTALAGAGVWPDGLCYTNELWGGTDCGYRWLSDSNYDWGQGLYELANWKARHGPPDLEVLPYGTGTVVEKLDLRRLDLGEFDGRSADEARVRLRGRTVALGTTILYGSFEEFPYIKPIVSCLRTEKPVGRTSTFLIYRLPEEAARRPSAVSRPGR